MNVHDRTFTSRLVDRKLERRQDRQSVSLQDAVELGRPILLQGPVGCGKVTQLREYARLHGIPVKVISLSQASDPAELFGRYVPNPHAGEPCEPDYIRNVGGLTRAVENNETVILDGVELAPPEVQKGLAAAVAYAQLAHPEARILATETPSPYAGRRTLDPDLEAQFEIYRVK